MNPITKKIEIKSIDFSILQLQGVTINNITIKAPESTLIYCSLPNLSIQPIIIIYAAEIIKEISREYLNDNDISGLFNITFNNANSQISAKRGKLDIASKIVNNVLLLR